MTPRPKKGYLLPAQVDPPKICVRVPVPDDDGHKRAFLGQLDALARWDTWERDTAKTGRLLARVWLEIADFVREQIALGLTDCGVDIVDVRQNPEQPCTLEKTYDGVTWEPFADLRLCAPLLRFNPGTGKYEYSTDDIGWFEVPDGPTDWPDDAYYVPPAVRPAPDNPEPDSPELACSIAINLTNELQRVWNQTYDNEQTLLQGVANGTVAVGTAAALLFPGAGIPVAGLSILALAVGQIWALISNAEQNAFDQSANERYRCMLLDLLSGGSGFNHQTQGQWAEAIAGDTENPLAGTVATMLRAIPSETLQWLAYQAAPVNDANACDCEPQDPVMYIVHDAANTPASYWGTSLTYLGNNEYEAEPRFMFGNWQFRAWCSPDPDTDPWCSMQVVSWETVEGSGVSAGFIPVGSGSTGSPLVLNTNYRGVTFTTSGGVFFRVRFKVAPGT